MNLLLSCTDEIFDNIVDFKNRSENFPSWDDFRNAVKWSLSSLENEAAKHKISNHFLQETKYALVAFIDELVLTSDWTQRDEWAKETLQLEFFKEHNAGEGFFQHLSELRQCGETNINILEIYFLCLQLGYKGKYQRLGEEKWNALQVELKNQIDNYRIPITLPFLPDIANQKFCKQIKRNPIIYWYVSGFSLLLFTVLYAFENWGVF